MLILRQQHCVLLILLSIENLQEDAGRQYLNRVLPILPAHKCGFEAVVPNPGLKLMDQVREVLRLNR